MVAEVVFIHTLSSESLHTVEPLFCRYQSNQSVIYSIFEKQFDGTAYVNDRTDPSWALLKTPFLQQFIAGTPTEGYWEEIEDILFNHMLPTLEEPELVVFADTNQWDGLLTDIFKKHNGVSDGRKIFAFSPEGYKITARPALPGEIRPILTKKRCLPFSHTETWSAGLLLEGETISRCEAIMVGKGQAEIDIFTEEAHRGKNYATMAAILLIDQLLKDELTPCWSAWPHSKASRHLAEKLGFSPMPDEKAWIWQEGM